MPQETTVPIEPVRHDPVREQVLLACQAMAKYAFAAGLKVPSDLSEKLARVSPQKTLDGATEKGAAADPKTPPEDNVRQLTKIHNRLAELVSPATPKTILLLATEEAKGGFWLFLGAVPLIRRLLAVATVSMIGFVMVSLSEQVDGQGFDLLANSGVALLLSELFLLSAASIGASFANLFEAQRYVKDGTFDPKYESSYWVRYVLGLMAGTILALLIPIEAMAGGAEDGGGGIVEQLGKPILALLGGFAASAVYRILNRIVAALESLVAGDAREAVAAQELTAKARLAEREIQGRMGLSAKLNALEQTLAEGSDPAETRRELARLRQEIILGEEAEEAA
jgi:hypothetical protein